MLAGAERTTELDEALAQGVKFQQAWRPIAVRYVDGALDAGLGEIREAITRGCDSLLARLAPKYRRASAALNGLLTEAMPKRPTERLKLVDLLREAQQLRAALREMGGLLETAFGGYWRAEETAFSDALAVLSWVARLSGLGLALDLQKAADLAAKPEQVAKIDAYFSREMQSLRGALDRLVDDLRLDASTAFGADALDSVRLQDMAARLRELSGARERYDGWRQLRTSRTKLEGGGLQGIVSALQAGAMTSQRAVNEFRYARAEAIWKRACKAAPALQKLADLDRHDLVRKYQELDRQRLADVRTLIRAKHLAELPQGAAGQMAVVRGELGKKRGHKPIRKLISEASEAVQRIKPAFLMSPISVAQFLPPGKIEFDLLVIDEASQVRPEDALGAIARCKQIVVVGDQKQLPPTAFFDRLTSNVEDADEDADDDDPLGGAAGATELESILSLCEARGLPARMLEWHYRSLHPSLIKVSNAEFYDNNLILPPSPLQSDPAYGLKFTRVNGAYDRGGRRTNTIEAQAIVERVIEHAEGCAHLSEGCARLSLGIVAFSVAQRSAIEELLEFERRRNGALDEFLREGKPEVFVKNIENVQGDERDVILVSIGYGPEQPGRRLSSMSFGPVNADGGERRLNVLFTRARQRCEIFASFEPGDIDLNRTAKVGPRVLKRYLEFAKTGILDERLPSGRGPDSPFEEDVADAIRGLGYQVDHQVGSAGFRIDLGVRHPVHPGQYMLAVECDGATYHSALWARERDRLRQGVLEDLGWRFHRIWSTDWFYRRAAEITRLRQALSQATVVSGLSSAAAESIARTADARLANSPARLAS